MKSNKKLSVRAKRFLALLMAVTMVTGTIPSSVVYAAPDEREAYSDDVTAGDVAAELATDTENTEEGEEDSSIEGIVANENPVLTTYDFDVTAFEEEYETVLPYGDYHIWSWDSAVKENVHVLRDGKDIGSLDNAKTNLSVDWKAEWQVQEETGWNPVTYNYVGSSSKVGKYKLVITIDAVENVSLAASKEILFEITKAEVQPTVTIDPVRPGTAAQSVKASRAEISATNDSFYYYGDNEASSDFTLTYAVKDAYTGQAFAGQLLKTGDYVVEITPVFTNNVAQEKKDSYILKPVTQKLEMDGLTIPSVVVTMTDKWKDNEGAAIDYSVVYKEDTEAQAPVASVDYTLKVQYQDDYNDDGSAKYVEISVGTEDLVYAWYDDDYTKLNSAPVNAGTYYYRITYQGKAGLYGSAYAQIKVVVTPKKLTLVPQWKETAPDRFYEGMTVRELLAAVTYIARDETNAEVAIDRAHIWGDYTSAGTTIPFEPIFKLQVETDETDADNKKVYEDVTDSVLVYDKPYRVVFSGQKAVYWGDAGASATRERSINSYTYGANRNYEVKVDAAELEKNALSVTMAQGVEATIDVSKIPALEGTQAANAGAAYDNPYTKVYDGNGLYSERANYKVAVVTAGGSEIASGIDSRISYIWYKQSGTRNEWNEETQKYDQVPTWTTVDSSNTIPNTAGSIKNGGNYKLVVSYNDPTGVNYAKSKEVFYRIEMQKVQIVPETTPAQVLTALTETKVADFDFSQIKYAIKTVVTSGESTVLNWSEGSQKEVSAAEKDFWINWKIEQKADSDQDYSTASGQFTKGISYRVTATLQLRTGLKTNYTDTEYYTEGTGDAAVEKIRYLNETWAITLKDMGTTELKIETDSTKLINVPYTGENYVIPAGAVKLTKADGTAVSDAEPEYSWYSTNTNDRDANGVYRWPVHGGTYTLYASYGGSETYKAVDRVTVGTFTITPLDLQVEMVVDTQVKAGSSVADYDFPLSIKGYVENDTDGFTWQGQEDADRGYYPAIGNNNNIGYSVKDEDDNSIYTYKGGKTYTIYASVSLQGNYARDYVVQSKGTKFTTVRDNSTVSATTYGRISGVALTDTVSDMTHTIRPEQGIDYINNYYLNEYDKSVSGNYFAFQIKMPAEYAYDWNLSNSDVWKAAFFKNSIENVEKAGGYVLGYSDYNYNDYITVAFDASAKDKKEFQIRWEEGYIETFIVDFSGAILGADLTKAVEPKSIAFNSPVKKMVVGGEQALDVKLTKKLQNDIICLQYTVSDDKVLCVDSESGYVVALATGKADVTVTPVYETEEGELKPIDGAKSAKVTITVTDVTAPKIQKVAALDDSVRVTYGQVSDGYRREVYVIKGSYKADEFESRISKMTNQNWEGLFEVAPAYYYYSDWTVPEWTNKQAAYTVTGLEPNETYTVYVRNVSRARTLADGCAVAISGKGSVKTFKTTKPQVKNLSTSFDYGTDKPVQYYKADSSEGYKTTTHEASGHFEVKLSTGSIKAGALGYFQKIHVYDAADTVDYFWAELPLKDAANKKTYVAPKLVYQVAERVTYEPSLWYDYVDGGNTDYYYVPTTYASVDKAGKIKLSGVATVYVRVVDSTTGIASAWRRLKITATPDSIAAKNLTFEVGQTLPLTSLVDYKEGKLVLKGDIDRHIVYDAELRKAVEDNEYFDLYEYYNGYWGITAVKPGGSMTLTLKDLYVGTDKPATITVKTKALAAATGLKASYIVDNSATMSFNYDGRANKFKVEVTDGRNRIIESQLYDKGGFTDVTYLYNKGYDMSNLSSYSDSQLTYDSDNNYMYRDAKGKYYYYFRISGLAKLSSYSVTVTAIWQDGDSAVCETSKPAKKSIKTTKMPAAYGYLQKGEYGGVAVYWRGSLELGSTRVTSGNTYELTVGSEDLTLHSYAKNMLTDTLTWTSSNKKVATIKANAGTYTATMKAVRAGTTVIELKSKVTKKVIGRWTVNVGAMEDARYNYFGENERQTFYVSSLSNTLASRDSAAAEADYSFATAIEGTDAGNTYTFTAPADGSYSFWTTGSSNVCGTLRDSSGNVLAYADGNSAADSNFKLSYELTAGEQVSLDVREWTFGDFAATLNICAE